MKAVLNTLQCLVMLKKKKKVKPKLGLMKPCGILCGNIN